MLDVETKRRIDNARDILVGKIPDPKSQVEQITLALTYKFMDDMDKQSEEWGGEASFFTGEYSRYSWSSIFDPKLGGYELLNLYSEALLKMNQNPNIPVLFREIFKNAYLPYRDPETLKSFLKEINGFCYDHSERLGDAYEYLLSVLGSQGDAGQFRTPRHIIDFIVKVLDPKKNETILDPACGTAGFLISSFKHIMEENTKDSYGDQLTPEERNRLISGFTGYDISPDMVRISLVNMYLHGFADPKIHEYDTLTSEERWNETADVILANPPFMSPTGGIRPHKRFSIQAKRSEVLFVDYIAEHLNNNGRAGIIVPEGIIFQSGSAYKALRKMLIENYLYAVVSLPAGVFNPYSGVKTSILFMDKTLVKKTDSILFVKVENDGFDLGAQRREIEKNDLPEAIRIIEDYSQVVSKGLSYQIADSNIAWVTSKEIISFDTNYYLSGERYKSNTIRHDSNFDLVKIGDICTLNPAKSGLKLNMEDEVSFVPMAILNEGQMNFEPKEVRKLNEVIKGYTYFEDNDVLLAKITPCFENGKSGIAKNLVKKTGFGSTEFYVLRPSEKVLPQWIYYFISSNRFLEQGKMNMTGSAGQQRLTKDFLLSYVIPLPSIEVQKEIAMEIEGYQKIIDGAKQVIDNYQPQIKINPQWRLVDLGDVIEFISGLTLSIPECLDNAGIPIISMNSVCEDGTITKEGIRNIALPKKSNINYLQHGDLLFNWRNGSKHLVGKTGYFSFEGTYVFASFLLGIRVLRQYLNPRFLWYLLNQFRKEGVYMSYMRQNVNGLFNREELKVLKIPLPTIEEQYTIVQQLDYEASLISANRDLISVFEGKIRSKIAQIWS